VVGGLGYAFKKWTDSDVSEMMVHPLAPMQSVIGAAGNIAGKPNRFSNTKDQLAAPIVAEGLQDVRELGLPGLAKFAIPDEAMRILQGVNNAPIPKRFSGQEWRRQLGLPSAEGDESSQESMPLKILKKQGKNAEKFYHSIGAK
jgi:hypothetical protein